MPLAPLAHPSSGRARWPVLVLLAALAGVAAWVALGEEGAPVGAAAVVAEVASVPPVAEPPLADVSRAREKKAAGGEAVVPDAAEAAAEQRAALSNARVLGRCVDIATGLALPGVRVTLVVYSLDPVDVLTDAEGRFEFPSPGNQIAWVEVRRPSPWLGQRPRRRLSPKQRFGEKEVVLELQKASSYRGRVVDAVTGEPVPDVDVQLSEDPGYSDRVKSDAEGYFASEGTLLDRRLDVRVEDDERLVWMGDRDEHTYIKRFELGEAVGPLELRVGIGPTYPVVLSADEPFDFDDVQFRLVESHGELEREWTRLRVGGEGRRWVRAPIAIERWHGSDLRLVARVFRRSLVAMAPVESASGIHPGVVRLRFLPSALVRGRVVDAAGKPVEGARITFTPRSGRRLDPARSMSTTTRSDGTFRGADVVAGAQRVAISAGGLPTLERDLEVPRGELELPEFVLGDAAAGSLSGRLLLGSQPVSRARLGRVEWLPIGAAAEPVEPRWVPVTPVRSSTDLSFEIGPLPAGEYEVRVVGGEFEWSPSVWRGSPPADNLAFRRLP